MTETPSFFFVTHARTLEELREEFISDIRRRLRPLYSQLQYTPGKAANAARVARAISELEDMEKFWLDVKIKAAKPRKQPEALP